MNYSVLETSSLFKGIPAKELRDDLEATPHRIQCYDKEETIFFLMEEANRIFSSARKYPCDVVAAEPATVMMFWREDLLSLMQKDVRILENLMTEIATATFMLQQRLELLSYNGIAQKAAFWLLTQARQTGKNQVMIPGSVSKWAMMMNVSRPSLHRELKNLEMRDMITYEPPAILIKDAEKLQQILG